VYLKIGLSIVLVFVGVKFLLTDVVGKVPIWISLPFIATAVGFSIAASLYKTRGQST
jgi:tellurite resistance protein TerC